ncbi:uncharacterized protein [Medicago truncatula]|uniref:uncharacterized protein n=1 Tax=Medicago truncatula TaxID=3880 RepID=UPI0019679066|nr:uncharacterized protein LOC120579600 [Medicago truncatula]
MASTSSSASTKRPYSPPPPPPEPPQQPPLRNPFDPDINPPLRNHLEEIMNKRRRIEHNQDKSLIHGLQLQEHATRLLGSNDLASLQQAIEEYTQTNNESLMKIFKSFAHHYINGFSLKLAKILELHPPLQTRTEIVSLLLQTLPRGINSSMSLSILLNLKNPLLNSLKVESEEILFPSLCEMMGLFADRLYRFTYSSWVELLQYVCDCISGDVRSNKKKGLLLLTEFSALVVQNREFWLNQGNLDLVFSNISNLINSMDQELKALAFTASLSLMLLSKDLQRTDVYDILLPILLNIINQHGEEEILGNRIKRLWDLAKLDDGNIFKGKLGEVFWCMIRVTEVEDVSEELKFYAVCVIKDVGSANLKEMGSLIKNLSHEEVRRVVTVAVNMLSCVIDDPLWYDVDDKNCITAGMLDAFYLGVFLFKSLTTDGHEDVFVPTAIEMMTMQYVSHVYWWFRCAAMLAISWIAESNIKGKDMMLYFNQVAMLALKSLDDLDPRVLWATMPTISVLSEHKELLIQDQYHKKFLEKLVPIIRCNSCARVQSNAVIAIHSLVKNCGLDKISPFGEHIVASVLVLLKHEKQKLQTEAIDTLKTFAVLMPVYIIHLKSRNDVGFYYGK